MLRRLAVTAAASSPSTALGAAPAASAGPLPSRAPPLLGDGHTEDRLTVTVTHNPGTDGTTYQLNATRRAAPIRQAQSCVNGLGEGAVGKDPFAPVPKDQTCTFIYGGPATAHVTGTWAGRRGRRTTRTTDARSPWDTGAVCPAPAQPVEKSRSRSRSRRSCSSRRSQA